MMTRVRHIALPLLLACVFLTLQGAVYPHILEHVSQHAHHDSGVHGTVVCSWMCAAGQDLGPAPELVPATISVIALIDDILFDSASNDSRARWVSRGPPDSSRV
ncbi:MAG TPA: hypothetical protein PKJ04_14025 [Nitrospira sp.]|nr:hypothetical protein [Nitrospira sp.]MBS0173951.1 hypothetical protein [Nitrospira sp.]MBX3336624.1 hypothetical protein [Nitrospira sp.]MCW5778206.1 hypothetical protein [Nitrospira sp.]HNK14913.1 hypothetical protein [Nitrospira sp.]